MPVLDISELNTVLGVLGCFIIPYGVISVKIKQVWYLGEALPAVIAGILLGPKVANFINPERWGSAEEGQTEAITLGVCRVVIGVQLVIAGYQLPKQYQLTRWKEMAMCLLPIMTMMWLCTAGCMLATVPKLTLLTALVIGSCVTCTDPILSQAIAKGPFADKFVARELREIISSEAGANDGFGFPFLMLATFLLRFAVVPAAKLEHGEPLEGLEIVATEHEDVGRLGGGVGIALGTWVIETWFYTVLMSVVYGIVVGYGSCLAVRYVLRKKWIDDESYLLYPTGLGLFIVGTCGLLGTDDLLACFVAGNALNWDGKFLEETENRHDEVNSCVDVLLNFGGFMYIGAILPWDEFNQPEVTGITYGRLIGLGIMVLLFRRIPSIFVTYKLMPNVCKDWKEALFMGYFGPIGIGAVFYLEHMRHLFPEVGEGDIELNRLLRAAPPVVYWLVLFSIVVHGLSIPALNIFYKQMGVQPLRNDSQHVRRMSLHSAKPKNSVADPDRDTFLAFNRFSRGEITPNAFNRSVSFSMGAKRPDGSFGQLGEPRDPYKLHSPMSPGPNMV